jgi:hypothetical protein
VSRRMVETCYDEKDVAYQVSFDVCPAEPDVGIMYPYIDLDGVSLNGVWLELSTEREEFFQMQAEMIAGDSE